ncbi:glycosyltransferase [Rivularia sp. PCC 7116]|uniref:glycosyltransferase n=1 Tax=Rivularia sp. PCC 7116 TaxID=373994 RepID=UPI00031DB70D|nr:glycosyltransferase [Rivularia sp. PCC 7116]
MHILFAYDHICYKDSQGNIYADKFPYWLWERYLSFFSKITVAVRIRESVDNQYLKKLDISSGPNVSFIEIPSLSSPTDIFHNRAEATEKLKAGLVEADALIARLPSEIGSLAIELAKDYSKPWITEVVGCPWDSLWNYGTWQGKVYAPIMAMRTRLFVHESSYVSYVSKHFLQNRYPTKGITVNCSNVEIPELDSTILKTRLERINNNSQKINIGLIGTLKTKYKGITTALKALNKIDQDLPEYEFRILGEGDPTRWKRLAKNLGLSNNRVTFCGTLPSGSPVYNWLDEIDLYIQPSFQEGLPRALVEAMSRGCPALGSTAGGIPELLNESCLHKPGDHHKLAELLLHATLSKDWQEKQAILNFEEAKNYTAPVLNMKRKTFWKGFVENSFRT